MATSSLPLGALNSLPAGYTPKEYSSSELYRLELKAFSGPLDLLLFLIHRDKIDISDIPIAKITANYLEYLGIMQEMDIEIAAEFLAMAAELIELKAKMLLPKEVTEEAEEEEDPREALAARLLAYKEVKNLAKALDRRPHLFRDTFLAAEAIGQHDEKSGFFRQLDPYLLIATLAELMHESHGEPVRLMDLTHLNVRKMMERLLTQMNDNKTKSFTFLLPEAPGAVERAVHFLAILELAKIHMVRLHQADPTAEIFVTPLYRDKEEAMRLLYSTLDISDEYDEEIFQN